MPLKSIENTFDLTGGRKRARSDNDASTPNPKQNKHKHDLPEMDPFQILPYNCQHKILQHIPGRDLLNMCEVSTYWRIMVEGDKCLMERAMNETLLKFEHVEPDYGMDSASNNALAWKDLDVYENYLQEGNFTKGFKHMAIENIALVQPKTVILYSHCLVSLKVESIFEFEHMNIPGCTFENLRKLEIIFIKNDWIDWLLKCQFNSIYELSIEDEYQVLDESRENSKFLKFLLIMPTLKSLRLKLANGFKEDDYAIINQAVCRLEEYNYYYIDETLIDKHIDTLKVLKLQHLELDYFLVTLPRFINLEELCVSKVDMDVDNLSIIEAPHHEKIKTFEVHEVDHDALNIILTHLPNVETIIISEEMCQPSNIALLANNAKKLKNLYVRGDIKDEIYKFYFELKDYNEFGLMNTDFELLEKDKNDNAKHNRAFGFDFAEDERKSKKSRKKSKSYNLEKHVDECYNVKSDPFKKLQNINASLILNHLELDDMLTMRQVSKNWKYVVDTSNNFLDCVTINIRQTNAMAKFLKENSVREYKFMEIGTIRGIRPNLVKYFADSLETIDIQDYDATEEKFTDGGFAFMKLREIIISNQTQTWLYWLPRCHFPVLTDFYINIKKGEDSSFSYFDHENLLRLLSKAPLLKKLTIIEDVSDDFVEDTFYDLTSKMNVKLETVNCTLYPKFMDNFLDSLVTLEVTFILIECLRKIYEKCKQLKELKITVIVRKGDPDHSLDFPINECITYLGVFDDDLIAKQLYRASPNVEELVFLDKEYIKFFTNYLEIDILKIVGELRKLKKITFKRKVKKRNLEAYRIFLQKLTEAKLIQNHIQVICESEELDTSDVELEEDSGSSHADKDFDICKATRQFGYANNQNYSSSSDEFDGGFDGMKWCRFSDYD